MFKSSVQHFTENQQSITTSQGQHSLSFAYNSTLDQLFISLASQNSTTK